MAHVYKNYLTLPFVAHRKIADITTGDELPGVWKGLRSISTRSYDQEKKNFTFVEI